MPSSIELKDQLLTSFYLQVSGYKNIYIFMILGGQLLCVKPWTCVEQDEFAVCEENSNVYPRTAVAHLIGRAKHESSLTIVRNIYYIYH
jgi:hypothetical protein